MALYSNKYFGKELDQITYSDLVQFFTNEQHETNSIEFKSFSGDLKGGERNCCKAVCSFLNSEGGLLIWGSPETSKNRDGESVCTGTLDLVDKKYERDQLINKLTDSISPLPVGIFFHRIENNGKYAYLIEIEESNGKPHQYDGVYWVRLDGQKRKAPHYLVETMIKKIRYPKIECFSKIDSCKQITRKKYALRVGILIVNQSILQPEENVHIDVILKKARFHPDNKRYYSHNVGLLHYGRAFTKYLEIIVDAPNPSFKYVVTVRGKSAPINSSYYVVDPSLYEDGVLSDLSYIMTETDENRFIHEREDDLDFNQPEFIKDFLNRRESSNE